METVPPAFADIFEERAARLTCRVSNMAAGGEGLEVTWLKGDEVLATKMSAPSVQPNGLLAAEGVATVSVEAWESGQEFTCRVTHPELLFPKEETMRKTTGEWRGEKEGGVALSEGAGKKNSGGIGWSSRG